MHNIKKNKPYDKRKSITSLGSDLTTNIQSFHFSGEMLDQEDNKNHKKDKL